MNARTITHVILPGLAAMLLGTTSACLDEAETSDDGAGGGATSGSTSANGSASNGTSSGGSAMGCPGEVGITFGTPVAGSTDTSGWDEDLAGWFDNSDVACDPFGTDYPAPFQVFSLPLPESSDWDVVLEPTAGVDVSLVGWTQGANDAACVPLAGYGVSTCEVSNKGGADAPEQIRINSTTNAYRLVILVATPPGGTAGDFTLTVQNH